MKLKLLFGLALSIFALTIVGCGGGSSGPASTTVSGEASKGPIIGGDVKIYAINADGTVQTAPLPTTPVTVTTKAPFGNYSAVISYAGPVKVVVRGNVGSTYKDEITGNTVDFNGATLNAVVANASGSTKVAVTPYTELAFRKVGPALTADSINRANIAVADAMGLKGVDIVKVMPSKNEPYKFALAVIAQAAGPTQTGLTALLTNTAKAIDVTTSALNDPTVIATISDATSAAFKNKTVNPTGAITGINPDKPQTVTLTADPLQGVTQGNGPVTLTATVTRLAGGPVPDGTPVTFTVTSGKAALTAMTATTGGIATAKLNSTDVGDNTINAKADPITSNSVSVAFILQPVSATLKLTTSGTFPAGVTKIAGLIGTLSITPAGVTVQTIANPNSTTGSSASPGVMTLSGVAATGVTLLPAEFTAPTATTPTMVLVPLTSLTGGFGLGEFATIVADVAKGTFPKRTDFKLSGFTAFGLDANGAQVALPDVTVDFILSLQ